MWCHGTPHDFIAESTCHERPCAINTYTQGIEQHTHTQGTHTQARAHTHTHSRERERETGHTHAHGALSTANRQDQDAL